MEMAAGLPLGVCMYDESGAGYGIYVWRRMPLRNGGIALAVEGEVGLMGEVAPLWSDASYAGPHAMTLLSFWGMSTYAGSDGGDDVVGSGLAGRGGDGCSICWMVVMSY